MPFSREDLLRFAAKPRQTKSIEVPELGEVNLLMLNGAERERFENALQRAVKEDSTTIRALFAIALVCEPDGKLAFSSADLEIVNSLPWTALEAIKEAGEALNALTPEANRDLAKN